MIFNILGFDPLDRSKPILTQPMAKKNDSKPKTPVVKKQAGLPDFDIYINEQGHIVKNYDVQEVNEFLNQHVPDKKIEEGDSNSQH